MKPVVLVSSLVAGLIGFALALGIAGRSQPAVPETVPEAAPARSSVEAVMQADRDFLAASLENGLEGWMSFMAADAARMPVLGQPIISGDAEIRALDGPVFASPENSLVWEPSAGYVFADGRHGITTGPYEARVGETVIGTGTYITFWRFEEGAWKVIFDSGAADQE